MNKQIIRVASFVILPLLIAGAAAYLFTTFNAGETKASVDVSPSRGSVFDLFKSYTAWPKSTTQKTGTAAEWLHTLNGSASNPTTFADVNGDGLADILVHQENINADTGVYHHYYGVLLNRGDLTFDFAYQCVFAEVSGTVSFYGDCGQ